MAAIFYDAVAGTTPVDYLYYQETNPSQIGVLFPGKNPGYAVGDKVKYTSTSGNSFNGPIVRVYDGPVKEGRPKGYTIIFLAIGNAKSFSGVKGGIISPVTTATPVAPKPAAVANPVVSASTLLKGGATAAPAPIVAVVEPKKGWFGLSKGAMLGVAVIGLVGAWLVFKKKKK